MNVWYYPIPAATAEDRKALLESLVEKFGNEFEESRVESIDEDWTYHYTRMIQGHQHKRVVIFRPAPSKNRFGCIRIRNGQNMKETIWDCVSQENVYIGLVPTDCPFEAMLVEIKLITLKQTEKSSAA